MKSALVPILAVVAIPVVVLAAAVAPGSAQTTSPATPPPATAPHAAPKPAHLKTLRGELVSVDEFAKTFTVRHIVDKKSHEITFSAEGDALAALTKIEPGDHLKVTYAKMGERPLATTITKLLLTASVHAQAVTTDKPADPQLVRARAEVAGSEGARSAETWAKKDAVVADRSLAAAVRYVEGALASDTARGLKAARSLGEKVVSKTTAATERAWAAATGVVRRAMEKLGHVVEVAWRPVGSG